MSQPLWRNRGLGHFLKEASAALGKLGPPPLWCRGHAALGKPGPPPFWGTGLYRSCDTGASAAWGLGPVVLWENHGYRRFGARALAALGKPGPHTLCDRGPRRFGETGASAALRRRPLLPLWGRGLEMSNSYTPERSDDSYTLDHPPRHDGCKRHQDEPHEHVERPGKHGHRYRSPPPSVQVIVYGARPQPLQAYAPQPQPPFSGKKGRPSHKRNQLEKEIRRLRHKVRELKETARQAQDDVQDITPQVPLRIVESKERSTARRREQYVWEQEDTAMSEPLWRNWGLRRPVNRGHHRFGKAVASAALGRGPSPLWGRGHAALGKPGPLPLWERGLYRSCDTGASAALGLGRVLLWGASAALGLGRVLLWGNQGLRRFAARALAALGKPGPQTLYDRGHRRFGEEAPSAFVIPRPLSL